MGECSVTGIELKRAQIIMELHASQGLDKRRQSGLVQRTDVTYSLVHYNHN